MKINTIKLVKNQFDMIDKIGPGWVNLTTKQIDDKGNKYISFKGRDTYLTFSLDSGDFIENLSISSISSKEDYKYYSDIIADFSKISNSLLLELLSKKSFLFKYFLVKDSGPFGQGQQNKNFDFLQPKWNPIRNWFKKYSEYELFLDCYKKSKQVSFRLAQIEVLGEDPKYDGF